MKRNGDSAIGLELIHLLNNAYQMRKMVYSKCAVEATQTDYFNHDTHR